MKANILSTAYPEFRAGGFTKLDGTVEFYSRINALINPSMVVLDFGAGRGAWFDDDHCSYRRSLRLLRGKVQRVVGFDVDTAIYANKSVDAAVRGDMDTALPFSDNEFDLIVADFVFEHVQEPQHIANELHRVLKPHGWICARTPNARSYAALAARAVDTSRHVDVLRRAQPWRKEHDVFPTAFRLNTMRSLKRYFPDASFENYSYFYQPEPSYHFNRPILLSAMRLVDAMIPSALHANIFAFLRRKISTCG